MADQIDRSRSALPEQLSDEEQQGLEAWLAPVPPAGVVEAALARAQTGHRRRRWGIVGAAAVAVVALGVGTTALWRTGPAGVESGGAQLAFERTTIGVADRATLVLEPGAQVSWETERGATRVVQGAGSVFYRVDPGGLFVVQTGAGEVRVTGTCFEVEVGEMKSTHAGAAGALVGATLASVALVAVYEGEVVASTRQGERAVAAGEQVQLTAGAAPAPVPARVARVAGLLRAVERGQRAEGGADEANLAPGAREVVGDTEAARAETEALRARVAELEEKLGVEQTMRQSEQGVALEPPDDLDERYGEQALLAAFKRAIAESGAPVEVTAVDCTEYPCIVLGSLDRSAVKDGDAFDFMPSFLDGPGFEAYQDTAKNSSVWRSARTRDGEVVESTHFTASLFPEDDKDARGPEIKRRLGYRARQLLEASRPHEE